MRRRCPHGDCPAAFWTAASLIDHLRRIHRYSHGEAVAKVYPTLAAKLPDVYADARGVR